MKIHTTAYREALVQAARAADVTLYRCKETGSRTSDRAFDVILSGESGRRMNTGRYGAGPDAEAASWDQWGIFLAFLYALDPDMVCGSSLKNSIYRNAEHFHGVTGRRFDWYVGEAVSSTSSPDYKVTAHRWEHDGWALVCQGHRPVSEGGRNARRECSAIFDRFSRF